MTSRNEYDAMVDDAYDGYEDQRWQPSVEDQAAIHAEWQKEQRIRDETSRLLAAHDDEQDSPEPGHRSWKARDLTAVLDGTWTPAQPTVGRRSDNAGLFYPGREHTISSETEGGKSWLALSATADEIGDGHHVLYVDFEDDEGGIVGRLLTMQLNRDVIGDRFHYLRPENPIGTGIHLDDLHDLLGTHQPTLAIIDGVTEAMSMHGLNPLDNVDVAKFRSLLARRFTTAGAAVVSLDHVNKDRETRGRYALGGVHKLNALTGAAYVLENRTPFGIGITGRSTLRIAKDRPGQLRKNGLPSTGGMWWYGDLIVTSHNPDFAEIEVAAPDQHASDDFRPTGTMTKLWKLINKHAGTAGISGRKVQDLAKGNAATNRQALALLEVDGYITATPHKPLKPYPPED